MNIFEINFDGLIGPTHNYAGLAHGNLPSLAHRYKHSYPKKAAFQGLNKINLLYSLGVTQGIIPPQERPDVQALRELGFTGKDSDVIQKAYHKDPILLFQCSSASSMWTANAATISPSSDTQDHCVHITPANLIAQPHRTLEIAQTSKILKMIFQEKQCFVHHPPLPEEDALGDEGAANHMRLSLAGYGKGIEIFVYGKRKSDDSCQRPLKYCPRQNFKASQIIASTHLLDENHVVFAQQNPDVIDLGVFHNDLIAVSNENVLLYHQEAFVHTPRVIEEVRQKFKSAFGEDPIFLQIDTKHLDVAQAVKSFLFNSQIVSFPKGGMALVSPRTCQVGPAKKVVETIIQGDNPIEKVYFVDLNQSMSNGGGPGCLRLRAVLTEKEVQQVHQGFIINDLKLCLLNDWVNNHFRDHLHVDDLQDKNLLKESRQALDELTKILKLGSIYSFQKN